MVNHRPSPERCIFEQLIVLSILGLVLTFTFDPFDLNSNQFIYIP